MNTPSSPDAPPSPETVPFLSIVVPVFEREELIGETLASLLGPCPRPYEVIVVDDGSRDATAVRAKAAIAEAGAENRCRVIVQNNAGPGAARNHGAALVRGRYVAFVDSDDLWFPWTLPTLAAVLHEREQAAFVFLQNVDFTRPARPEATAGAGGTSPVVERHPGFLAAVDASRGGIRFASSNVVVRRDVLAAFGGFAEAVRCSEDTDLFLRAGRAGDCLLIRQPAMLAYAIGAGGTLTSNADCVISGLRHMLAEEEAGRYPGGAWRDSARTQLHASSVVYSARIAFATGHPLAAYGLVLRHAPLVLRGGRQRWLPRLLLTPLLALVRPQSYAFRFRPRR